MKAKGFLIFIDWEFESCTAKILILIESWLAEIAESKNVSEVIETITKLNKDEGGLLRFFKMKVQYKCF